MGQPLARRSWQSWLCVLWLGGCAPAARAPVAVQPAARPAASGAALEWVPFDASTFARAQAEGKLVILDGAAAWCHWCHVMDATTYAEPAVRELLRDHFVAARVDIDARPDVAERYGEWGWPATVLFAADGTELGTYRGYLAPDAFVGILGDVVARRAGADVAGKRVEPAPAGQPLGEETLAWIARWADAELDDYWDEKEGGWGKRQKAPLGGNNAWVLHRMERGDAVARQRATFTLDKQSALLDPVWGGIYQYSAAADWAQPHFEKLMTFQAAAIENYAVAHRLGGDAASLRRARGLQRYVERFLHGADGSFYTSQDADLAGTDGHAYYALDERARLAKGVPRVETAAYAKENGQAIAAYVALFEATHDDSVLATAERAAERILRTHRGPGGVLRHAAEDSTPFLGDSAAFGFGLMRLHDVTKKPAYLQSAREIADSMLATMTDPRSGALFAGPVDDHAVGVFAIRRVPFEENVMAVRFLARLAKATGAATYGEANGRILHAIATPEQVKAQGRTLGAFLLALAESKDVRGN